MSIMNAGELVVLAEREERDRCIAICQGWIDNFKGTDIKFTSAREYAVDAVKDIIDLIQSGHTPADVANSGESE